MGALLNNGSQPVMKYCVPIPTRLDTTQYSASPLGNVIVRSPSMMGIIHSIICEVDCCLGSTEGVVVIFCWTHVEPPTSSGITRLVGSGSARFIHRNPLFSGTASCTNGAQE